MKQPMVNIIDYISVVVVVIVIYITTLHNIRDICLQDTVHSMNYMHLFKCAAVKKYFVHIVKFIKLCWW